MSYAQAVRVSVNLPLNADNKMSTFYKSSPPPVNSTVFEVSGVAGAFSEGGKLMVSGKFGADGPTKLIASNMYGKTSADTEFMYTDGAGLAGNAGLKFQDVDLGIIEGAGPIAMLASDDAVRLAAGISEANWKGHLPFKQLKVFTAIYGTGEHYNSKDVWAMMGDRGDSTEFTGMGNDLVIFNDTGTSITFHSNNGLIYPNGVGAGSLGNYEKDNWTFSITNLDLSGTDISIEYETRCNGEIGIGERTPELDFKALPHYQDRVKLGAYSQATGVGVKRWFGAFYVAVSDELSGNDSYANCCVEILNAATDETATIKGIMPASFWSDSTLMVDAWTLGIPLADAYIRVRDKDDNASNIIKLSEVL